MGRSKIGEMLSQREPGEPEYLHMPPDDQIGVYPTFTHSEGWIRDRIKIFQQEGPGGAEPVTLSINGFRIDIPREVECDIARPFVENLRHAVETRMERNDRGEDITRDVPRFHWVVIKEGVNLPELKAKMRETIDATNKQIHAEASA